MRLDPCPNRPRRRASAAVELAIMLPFLLLLLVICVDFARIYRLSLTLTNCARNGALYGSIDPSYAKDTSGIQNAALIDAGDLAPQTPSVNSKTGNDASGYPYVSVTVTGTFQTITRYPGIPSPMTVARTVEMRVTPYVPANSTP